MLMSAAGQRNFGEATHIGNIFNAKAHSPEPWQIGHP